MGVSVIDNQDVSITAEPAISQWHKLVGSGGRAADELLGVVRAKNRSLGIEAVLSTGPVIATGHQGWLWHPGILAKYIAMKQGADHLAGSGYHLVVDHDVHDALSVELPVRDGERLGVTRVRLADEMTGVPTGFQPAVDAKTVAENLDKVQRRLGERLLADVSAIGEAFIQTGPRQTLAEQMAGVLGYLMHRWVGNLPVLMSSDLHKMALFQALLEQMLDDAKQCAAAYNRAVRRYSQARMTELIVERDRVELPLWVLRWGKHRQRVFADFADSVPVLTDEDGETLGLDNDTLAPRALLLTAIMRRWCCDLFIHGRGGQIYDRVMEDWQENWLGEKVGPMATVSSDVTMAFDSMALGDRQSYERAVWYAHHLKHNIDQLAEVDGGIVKEKQSLLSSMNDDRNKQRRAEVFTRIKAINAKLADEYAKSIKEAKHAAENARLAMDNQQVAAKRDWCFALYDVRQIDKLAETLAV